MIPIIQLLLYYSALSLVTVFLVFYLYYKYSYTYWARKGIPYIQPKFPLGNNDCLPFRAPSYGIETRGWYNELRKRDLKLGGAWSWSKPILVLTDPDYIKDVLVKDFDHFMDRDFYRNPKINKGKGGIFVAEKEAWRSLRHKLTPTFTSAKMKMMLPTVVKCSEPMIEYLENITKTGENIDIKEVLASFTTDVIGCVAFGLEFGSFKDKDAKFRQLGREFSRVDFTRAMKHLLIRMSEDTARMLGVSNIPDKVGQGLVSMLMESIKYRRENNIKRPDYMQLLIDLLDSTKHEEDPFTFVDLVPNVIVFFIAGFETSSSTMQFALYELARNPDLQEKARAEILSVLKKHNNEITYEAYQEMTYLRQVIDETLRMYPPVPTLARRVIKPYTFKNSNFKLEKGDSVIVSPIGLHYDPEYFPRPERFDPDRFTAESKAERHAFAYLPFGDGPRNCIGMRFGLMQSAIGLIAILRKFRLSISQTSKMPLTLAHGTFLLAANETLFLKAEQL